MMRPTDPTLFLERVDGETLKTVRPELQTEERAFGVVKYLVDSAVSFLSLQTKGFRW